MAAKLDELQVSGSVDMNFKCTWTIPCFSSLDSRVGKYHSSNVFKLEENRSEWKLSVYPGGKAENSEGFVSCFIRVTNNTRDFKCKYRMILLNTNDEVLFDRKSHEWSVFINSARGYAKTINTSDLETKLIDDILVFTVEATYSEICVKESVYINRGEEIMPLLKLADDFKKLWISKEKTDCVIAVGGDDIPVHSAVLGARSKVFLAMFKYETLEKDTRRVEVTDFGKDTIDSFLEFIYSVNVSKMDFDLALELLRASDKYEVSDLKLYCFSYLKSFINDENVCQVLLCADIYNAEKLRSHALEYFCKNLSEENFESQRSIFASRPQLLCDIVKGMINKYKMVQRGTKRNIDGQKLI